MKKKIRVTVWCFHERGWVEMVVIVMKDGNGDYNSYDDNGVTEYGGEQ